MYPLLLCDHWGLIYRIKDYESVSVDTIVKNNHDITERDKETWKERKKEEERLVDSWLGMKEKETGRERETN